MRSLEQDLTEFLNTSNNIDRIIFNVFKDTDKEIYKKILGDV